jgi:hypothetical protein
MLECIEEVSPTDPKLQDLHYTEQQQEIREVTQCGSNTHRVAEAGSLNPDQGVTVMIICIQKSVDKGNTMGHTVTQYIMRLYSVWGEVTG